MKYLPLFHILPPEIVKIIIDYIKIYYKSKITNFYRIKFMKKDLMKDFINLILVVDNNNNLITSDKISRLNFIINNNWNYNRYFWCCFTNLLAYRIMKLNIHLLMISYNTNIKEYNKNLNKIICLWFKLCKKYNLVLNITFYNYKLKKTEQPISLPAKNFIKPINNFHNILHTPLVKYNEKNIYYIINRAEVFNTLSKYSNE